jgi:hypothetical protein
VLTFIITTGKLLINSLLLFVLALKRYNWLTQLLAMEKHNIN